MAGQWDSRYPPTPTLPHARLIVLPKLNVQILELKEIQCRGRGWKSPRQTREVDRDYAVSAACPSVLESQPRTHCAQLSHGCWGSELRSYASVVSAFKKRNSARDRAQGFEPVIQALYPRSMCSCLFLSPTKRRPHCVTRLSLNSLCSCICYFAVAVMKHHNQGRTLIAGSLDVGLWFQSYRPMMMELSDRHKG